VVVVLVASMMLTLAGRLYYVQLLDPNKPVQTAGRLHDGTIVVPAPRGQIVDHRRRGVRHVPEVRADPPEARPVLRLPVLDQQGAAWVGREVVLSLEPARGLGLDLVDGDAEVAVVAHGIHDRLGVGAPLRVQGAQHAVQVCGEALPRLVGVHPHVRRPPSVSWR